jgi:outer membrane protein assembly factor BamD
MTDLRDDTERVMKKNYPESRYYAAGLERKKAWWQLW